MKHLVRSIKYFFYFAILFSLIIAALVLIGAVEGNINEILEGGYGSLWKIAIFFAMVAAVYPKLGFITQDIQTGKSWSEARKDIMEYMTERNYCLESENEGTVTFRLKGTAGRLSKMFEDRLTLKKTEDGFQLEGLRKDVMRLAMGLENRLNLQDAE